MTVSETVSAGQLRAFIERIERLEEEKKTISDDIKDVKAEAKGSGFSVAIINEIIKLRKKDPAERAEQEFLLDIYKAALGMLPLEEYADRDEPRQSYAEAKSGQPAYISAPLTETEIEGLRHRGPGEITEHEQPETADEVPAQDSGGTATGESPSGKSNAAHPVSEQELADADLNDGTVAGQTAIEVVTAGETAQNSQSDDDAFSEVKGTARPENAAGVEPSSSDNPSAATPAEPEAVPPTPPAASGTISPSSDLQEVPGGNLSKPSPDAGAEDGSAHAGRSSAQSEQAAHHSDDDVPAFLKQERAERQPNPKCQKPGNCKWDHGQVSCWRCNSAPAARESEVA